MDDPGPAEFATPALMRAARGAYAQSIRAQLHVIGVDDLPRNGAFLLAGIDTTAGPRQDLPAELGVTKQAVSQVIDTLVNRGYLNRGPDPRDRRRISLELTERGQQVVEAVQRGVLAVDLQLQEQLPAAQIDGMRAASARPGRHQGRRSVGRNRKAASCCSAPSVQPDLPGAELAAALAHYSRTRLRHLRLR